MQTKEQKENWLKERLKYVGASEISTVIKSECTEEEMRKAMGSSAEEFLKDDLFKQSYSLFLEKIQEIESPKFSEGLSKFGHSAEKYVIEYINKEFTFLKAKNEPQEVVKCPEFHRLAGFTPDGSAEFLQDCEFNSETRIRKYNDPVFPKKGDEVKIEIKTSNRFSFFKENDFCLDGREEPKFQYINQGQYQTIDNKAKWSIIAYLVPKEKHLDTPHYQGEAVILFDNLHIKELNAYEILRERYDIYLWIYPVYKKLHALFKTALDKWEQRLQNGSELKNNFLKKINNFPKIDFSKEKDVDSLKRFMKKNYDDIKSYAISELGADTNGIIQITPEISEKYPDLCDTFSKNKLHREEKSDVIKAVDEGNAEILNIFLKLGILGVNQDKSTIYANKTKSNSLVLQNNFKKLQDILENKTKIKNDEMTGEDFMSTL